MQSLSQMLSPLKNCGPNSSIQESTQRDSPGMMDFQTPLSIMIPNDYDTVTNQNFDYPFNNGQTDQVWLQTFNQEPLLTSKSPEDDKLTSLNMHLGNQYTYQMNDMEPGTYEQLNPACLNDPRVNYDTFTYQPAQVQPFKDAYYQYAYDQPKIERTAIRHKMEDGEDIGPEAKRHCGESSTENGQRVIVQETASMGNISNMNDSERDGYKTN